MNRTDFQNELYNPIIKDYSKGFLDEKEMSKYKNNYTYGYVLQGMEFRPDLVAKYYMGDPELSWLITYVNEFEDGIKDYILGRKIKIPGVE